MLTLHAVPEAGETRSVSYGGVGMNASEYMHHKDTVINVGTLKDSHIGPEVKQMVNSLKLNSQDFLYFDTGAPEINHSVDSRMNEVGTRAPGAKSINGLEVGVEHGKVELDQSGFGVIGLEVVRCSNLGCTRDCSVVIDFDGKQVETRHVDECMNRTSDDGTRVFKEYNYKNWAYEEQRTTQHDSGVWEVKMSKTGNATSTKKLLRMHALKTALIDIGKDGGCPDRVKAVLLIRTTMNHLRHIYAEVRRDAEVCTLLEGRGSKQQAGQGDGGSRMWRLRQQDGRVHSST
jgi:hypothetical protein